jgi:hypothetical protein
LARSFEGGGSLLSPEITVYAETTIQFLAICPPFLSPTVEVISDKIDEWIAVPKKKSIWQNLLFYQIAAGLPRLSTACSR